MTPEEERELDEWLAGLQGKAEPKGGTGYDPLDARIAEGMRRIEAARQAELSDIDIARAWASAKQELGAKKRRGFGVPFSSGLAAGLVLATVGLLTMQAMRQPEPDLGYKGPEETVPAGATWTATLIASDPAAKVEELTSILRADGVAYAVEYEGGQLVVTWATRDSAAVNEWLRVNGLIVAPDAERVEISVVPREGGE